MRQLGEMIVHEPVAGSLVILRINTGVTFRASWQAGTTGFFIF